MKQYKVIGSIAICAAQKERLKRDTVKPESYFVDGQIAELTGRGMIAELVEEETSEEVITSFKESPDLTKLSKPDLQKICTEKGIEFLATDTKPTLIDLITKSESQPE